MRTVLLSSLLAVAVGCSTARVPSAENQEQPQLDGKAGSAAQGGASAAADVNAGGPSSEPPSHSETPGQTEPVGAACRAAGACDAGAATSVEADSEDASAPDADGGSAAQSVDYSCSTDGDCEVKDLGGCCGYNPRCVNRLRDVPGFECPPGGASPCGFLVIDACVCRDQVCRNVQGDREI